MAITSAAAVDNFPAGRGREAVRFSDLSRFLSQIWFKAPAAAAVKKTPLNNPANEMAETCPAMIRVATADIATSAEMLGFISLMQASRPVFVLYGMITPVAAVVFLTVRDDVDTGDFIILQITRRPAWLRVWDLLREQIFVGFLPWAETYFPVVHFSDTTDRILPGTR